LNLGESALIANAVTNGLFNTNLYEFFSGKTNVTTKSGGMANFGGDGASVISLPELLGIGKGVDFGGNYGPNSNFSKAVSDNLKENFGSMAVSVIGIPIAFKLGKKLTSKPRATTNRMLKMAGLQEVKV